MGTKQFRLVHCYVIKCRLVFVFVSYLSVRRDQSKFYTHLLSWID